MKEFDKGENGQVMILVTFFLLVLVCFVAFAVDVGMMFRHKRNMQIAADSAAVAGALASKYGPGTATSAADAAALANGVTNVSYVAVSTSPTDGYHQGAGFVEVVVSQPMPTFFMRVANIPTITIGARSVAGIVPSPACLISLDPSIKGAFNVQGSAVVDTPNCAIHINSSDQAALCSTGNATITAPAIGIDGYQNRSGNCNGTQANVSTDAGQVADPYGNTPWLDTQCNSGTTGNGYTFTGSTVTTSTVLPSSSVSNTVGTTTTTANVTCFSAANVTINSGVTLGSTPTTYTYTAPDGTTQSTLVGGNNIFVFENGVQFAGTAIVSGTLDLQGGNYPYGNTQLSMYAPADTTATYNSLAFMVDPLNTAVSCSPSSNNPTLTSGSNACLQVQFGSGAGNIDGIIYAPNATVYMQDNGGSTTVAGIVAGAMFDKASTLDINENYNLAHATTAPMSTTAMVE